MLCEHAKETIDQPLRRSGFSSADSVVGSTTVLNDLVLSETDSKPQQSSKVKTKKSQSLAKSFKVNLWKRSKGGLPQPAAENNDAVTEDINADTVDATTFNRNGASVNFAEGSQVDYRRDRSHGPTHPTTRSPSPIASLWCQIRLVRAVD